MPRPTELARLTGHKDRVWCVAWSPSGDTLASCGGDKLIKIWQKQGDKYVCVSTLDGVHSRTVRCVAWSPNGRFLASASFDGTTAIWGLKDGEFEMVATLEGHENEVKSVAWSASGNLLATCSRDKSVWIWESESESDWECLSVLHGHSQDVKMVRWHPADEFLMSASYDDTMKLWSEEEDDWYCTETVEAHSAIVWGMAFDQSGHFLASCDDEGRVIVWERVKNPDEKAVKKQVWRNVCALSGHHSRSVFSVDWSKTGLVATGGADDRICLFAENAEEKGPDGGRAFVCVANMENAHSSDVNCVSWNPSGTLLASASDDMTIKIWAVPAPV